MKIQTKTTILFTVLTATIFIILNITVYFFIDSFAHRDFNKRLELRARLAAKYRFEQNKLSTQAVNELQQLYLEHLPEEKSEIVSVDSISELKTKPTTKNLPNRYLQEIVNAEGTTVYYESSYRHFAGLLYKAEDGDYIVIGSATNEYGSEMMRQLRTLKIASWIGAIILTFSVGLYFSRKTFQPVRNIIGRVKDISKGNLHLRLPEQKGSDEIAELTRTFNQMLNRLETAFEAQNNFISNASHELRTPLTAIIGEADYALSKERSTDAYRESLQQITAQAEKLQVMSKGLLALAQTGFNGQAQSWMRIRLDELLFDVKADCDAILPGNNVQVCIDDLPGDEESISISGNYDLLKMAINNIVLNACKYSKNKPVSLQLQFDEAKAIVLVKDFGIGIPQEEMKYIYDPFFRASNTAEFEGYGIGMPLSNNIIRLHNGSIDVQSTVGQGTEVKLTLPLK